jgi:alanine-synthesizing transaminase
VKLSQRTAWSLAPSPWSQRVHEARRRGLVEVDLTVSNPTEVGLVHPPEVYAELSRPGVERYEPHPLGLPSAREAVADHYAVRGLRVDPQRVWLCAGTSEAYGQLLTLLCDPGESVLVPAPGYPLLDVLGDLASVRRRPYPLALDGGWRIDLDALAANASAPDVRAILVVAPGNPTGAYVSAAEWNGLVEICVRHELALVVDEVFADYPLEAPGDRLVHVPDDPPMPCFVLSGLSKIAALPQMKLSWVVALGPARDVSALLARAEHVADATLSVGGPVQRALPRILSAAEVMRERILSRLHYGLVTLRKLAPHRAIDVPPVEGGWTALLRLPQTADDDAWAAALLASGVLTQPGFLFDLPARPPWLAVSLLSERAAFERGIARLLDVIDATLA